MERVANGQHVPGKYFHDLKGGKNNTPKEYEFKHGDLRVYAIQDHRGKIIVLCGFKNKQRNEIVKFRALKEQYLNSLKPKK